MCRLANGSVGSVWVATSVSGASVCADFSCGPRARSLSSSFSASVLVEVSNDGIECGDYDGSSDDLFNEEEMADATEDDKS